MFCAAYAVPLATPGLWGAQTVSLNLSMTQTPSALSGVSQTTRQTGQVTILMNTALYLQGTQNISTSSKQALQVGGVTPLGYWMIRNIDPYNYVSIFSNSSGSSEFNRLYPGDVCFGRLGPSATPYLQGNANAGGTSVQIEVYLTAS